MKKQDLLDICDDIKLIEKGFRAFREVETFEEFYQIAKSILESVKKIKIEFFYDDDDNERVGTELYVLFEDEKEEDDFFSEKNGDSVMLDYECWFYPKSNVMLIQNSAYILRINNQTFVDVDDAIVLISSMDDKDECDEY